MLKKTLAAGALTVLTLSAQPPAARADDFFQLDLRGGAGISAAADTLAVRGFFRPYYGYAYRPYFYPRFYRPGVSFYYSRPYFGYSYGFYRPYAFSYYSPSYFYPSYYYASPVYYSPYYYCPINDSGLTMPYATSAQVDVTVLRPYPNGTTTPLPYAANPQPSAPKPVPETTYPYDGGPSSPVPMPGTQPAAPTPATVPLEGRAVSLPRTQPKYTYPAYGEDTSSFATDRAVPAKAAPVQQASR